MKRKLNISILDLFASLEGVLSTAHSKIDSCKFTARGVADRLEQTPANSTKKAHRKIVQASRRRNRV